jgi:hypothetical protein
MVVTMRVISRGVNGSVGRGLGFGPRVDTAGLSSMHRLINATRKKAYPINDSLRVGDSVGDRSYEHVDRRGTPVQRWAHR